jgi:hypothetical protein
VAVIKPTSSSGESQGGLRVQPAVSRRLRLQQAQWAETIIIVVPETNLLNIHYSR